MNYIFEVGTGVKVVRLSEINLDEKRALSCSDIKCNLHTRFQLNAQNLFCTMTYNKFMTRNYNVTAEEFSANSYRGCYNKYVSECRLPGNTTINATKTRDNVIKQL
jgi:hypothetical protein